MKAVGSKTGSNTTDGETTSSLDVTMLSVGKAVCCKKYFLEMDERCESKGGVKERKPAGIWLYLLMSCRQTNAQPFTLLWEGSISFLRGRK